MIILIAKKLKSIINLQRKCLNYFKNLYSSSQALSKSVYVPHIYIYVKVKILSKSTQVRRNRGLECTWKPAGMNTNIFPESFFILGSITMSSWYKIRFSLLIPQKSENFDILSRFNLHMLNINLLVTIRWSWFCRPNVLCCKSILLEQQI